jgi:hypothetical protein
MAWWDIFKGIFKDSVQIKDIIKFNVNITINQNAPLVNSNEAKKTLDLNIEKLTLEERLDLQKGIRQAVTAGDVVLIEQDSNDLIDDFVAVDSQESNQKILIKLRPYVTAEDLKAWRAALYLRDAFQKGNPVDSLREGIIRVFGDRGRVISNLCTAGYVEKMILPLVAQIDTRPDFNGDAFRRLYGTIIKESAFAVFVHNRLRPAEISSRITDKIETNKRYGQGYVCIHGIGKTIIKRIRRTVDDALAKFAWLEKTDEKVVGEAIFIRLEFTDRQSPK